MHNVDLDDDDLSIAAVLKSNRRKIKSLVAAAEAAELHDADPHSSTGRKRPVNQRSVAEDYRLAQRVQRVVQGLSVAQIVCTMLLVLMGHAVLVIFAFMEAGGLVGSFAQVQLMEAFIGARCVAVSANNVRHC